VASTSIGVYFCYTNTNGEQGCNTFCSTTNSQGEYSFKIQGDLSPNVGAVGGNDGQGYTYELITEPSQCSGSPAYYAMPYWSEQYLTDSTVNGWIDPTNYTAWYYPALMYFDDPGWGSIGFDTSMTGTVTEQATVTADVSGSGVSYSNSVGYSATKALSGMTGSGADCTSTTCPLNSQWEDYVCGSFQTWYNVAGLDYLSINTYPRETGAQKGWPWQVGNGPLFSDPFIYPNMPSDYNWLLQPGEMQAKPGSSNAYLSSVTTMQSSGYGVSVGFTTGVEGVSVSFGFNVQYTYSSSTSFTTTVSVEYPSGGSDIPCQGFGLYQEYDVVGGQEVPGPLHLVPTGTC
jgi:hypothetical protein